MTDLHQTPPVPRWLRCWTVFTVLAALPLVTLGAEVTTKRVGMVDPKGFRAPWHLFTLSGDQLYLGYLIEHGHRLAGFVVGICCIVLAVGMTVAARGWLYRSLGWLALVAVSTQGVLGIYRVDLNAILGQNLALLHGCLAQLVFAVLVAVAVMSWVDQAFQPDPLRLGQSDYQEGERRGVSPPVLQGERRGVTPPVEAATGGLTPRRSPFMGALVLAVLVYVQVVFGAITRHLFDGLAQRLHILLAFVVIGLVFMLLGRLRRQGDNPAARWVAYLLTGLVLVQPVLGVEAWIRRFGSGTLPDLVPSSPTLDLVRTGHHLLGTLIFATTVALAVLLWRPQPAGRASQARAQREQPDGETMTAPGYATQLEGSA